MTPLLIPPRRITPLPGRFAWPERPELVAAERDDLFSLRQLASELRAFQLKPDITVDAEGSCALRVVRDRRITHAEGYRLTVTPEGIELRARTAAGAFYGIQTLRALTARHGRHLPACVVKDHPDFKRRGVYLDCSRGRVPRLETLKELVNWLAHWKINELQLYVENVFLFEQHPKIGRGFSPFTAQDLLDLQAHCEERHVRLVPSLTSFGHFERILGLPEYADLGEKPGHLGYRGGTTLCPGDPRSLRLVADLYAEFLPLFHANEFNACCDETWELGQGRSRRRVARLGKGRVYLDFIKKLHRLCEKHGKRMNIWSDIVLNYPDLLSEVPSDVVMLNWDYEVAGVRIARSRELAEAGLDFMACPGTHGWWSHGTRLVESMTNVAAFAREGRRRGAAGLLNTDWGDFGHRNPLGVSLHGFAHGAAHAWNGREVDESSFTDTFARSLFGSAQAGAVCLIRQLGSVDDLVGPRLLYPVLGEALTSGRGLYRGIRSLSPVWFPPRHRRSWIDAASAEGCREVLSQREPTPPVPSKEGTPKSPPPEGCPKGGVGFSRATMRELKLADRMDRLACERILAGKALRAGERVSASRLRALAARTRAVAKAFAANWEKRYRPSRLGDNLRLFENAATDAEKSGS